MTATTRHHAPEPTPSPPSRLRDTRALAELFLAVVRRDLQNFFPQCRFEPLPGGPTRAALKAGPRFRLVEPATATGDGPADPGAGEVIELFGVRYGVAPRGGGAFSDHERRMIRAIGAVQDLRYHHLFQIEHSPPLDLYRVGSDDHYVAAFLEPAAYALAAPGTRTSRIAATIQTLRTAALSTYENRRVSTGALLLGPGGRGDGDGPAATTPPDALAYGVELTALKSVHKLCDGRRTLFLVDREGRLAEIIDVERWAERVAEASREGQAVGDGPGAGGSAAVPCARAYAAHARATRAGGHVCLVLSPNQEIKLFEGGAQAFAFAHGRWRILDPAAKYAVWRSAVAHDPVARALYQTALDLAEARQGGLLVVVNDPAEAVGRLIAPHDLLDGAAPGGPPAELDPGDPLAKRALHYLARGRAVTATDPPVLEALAGLDGALVTDRAGRVVAFGAILRHDPSLLAGPVTAEGARTTAALIASRFGPVLKVSEDGVVSCFLDGARVWDL
jgi:hypothetical protein